MHAQVHVPPPAPNGARGARTARSRRAGRARALPERAWPRQRPPAALTRVAIATGRAAATAPAPAPPPPYLSPPPRPVGERRPRGARRGDERVAAVRGLLGRPRAGEGPRTRRRGAARVPARPRGRGSPRRRPQGWRPLDAAPHGGTDGGGAGRPRAGAGAICIAGLGRAGWPRRAGPGRCGRIGCGCERGAGLPCSSPVGEGNRLGFVGSEARRSGSRRSGRFTLGEPFGARPWLRAGDSSPGAARCRLPTERMWIRRSSAPFAFRPPRAPLAVSARFLPVPFQKDGGLPSGPELRAALSPVLVEVVVAEFICVP